MSKISAKKERCPDCAVYIGQIHLEGCDVERCPMCGFQRLGCDCIVGDTPLLVWSGYWPGVEDCQRLGLYAKMTGRGWMPCDINDILAVEDLNRLYAECVWDREAMRWEKRQLPL